MDLTSPALHFFDAHRDADEAIRKSHEGGFDVGKPSLAGKGFHSEEHPVGFHTLGDRVRSWGGERTFWDGIRGWLTSPAVFFVPAIGLPTLAGPVVVALAGAPAILARPRPVSVI